MNWGKNFVLLETLRKDKANSNNLLFTEPLDLIYCFLSADIKKCFVKMERYRQKGFYLAGFFSYELGYFLEDTLYQHCPKHDYPLMWFGVYKRPVKPLLPKLKNSKKRYYLSMPELAGGFSQYVKVIDKIKQYIEAGETYQINYTTGYDFNFIGNIFEFYNELKRNQKVSYSALINHHGNCIVSLSPELFFRIDSKQKITVKPMKGTAPPDSPPDRLRQDAKNISENIMIVDLLRNDLGRICTLGSVKVKNLFAVEKYETLLQMTSTVCGKVRPEIKMHEIIRSLFPCGSVTGAPKIQSMKIISALEKQPRNIYTGAIGYFAPDGSSVFNVAIRTIDMKAQPGRKYSARMGIGSGIVFDSQPKEEYAECQLKAKFLVNAMPEFALIETMLFADGKIKYLAAHLSRLKSSAAYFFIPCSLSKIKSELNKYTACHTGKIRLRLLLNSNGNIVLEHQPIKTANMILPKIAVSEFKTRSDDPFLYHKSTQRMLYDSEYKRYASKGYFDVIFTNEKNQVTEGAISNIFVHIKGNYYTPPIFCGLLCGIQRQVMIKKLKACEKILLPEDLKKADQIILTNSVRGTTEVMLC